MAQEAENTPNAEGQESEAAKEGEKPTTVTTEVGGKTFDEAYVKELRSEAASNRKKAAEYEARLQELEDRDKSELERLTGKLSKAEQDKAKAESALLRFQVAAEKQVPADAVDLLHGSTREELEATADRILSLAKQAQPEPEFDGGAREPAPEPKTPERQHDEAILKLLGLSN